MSRNELLDAYQRGRISRRTFVKGMAALGFSVTVANVLADRVRAAGAATGRQAFSANHDDCYDDAYHDCDDEDGHHGPPPGGITLPNTGAGTTESSSWMKPVAIVGAGAAAAAAFLRNKKSAESPAE